MTPATTLLLLRLISAALLLAFLAIIAWLIYRDLQASTQLLADRRRPRGALSVISVGSDNANSSENGERYPLLPLTTIGRSPNNTLVLKDDYASGTHALISLKGEQWWLEDLGSRNGTLLNDLPLETSAVLSAGDVITVGNTQLKIEFWLNGDR